MPMPTHITPDDQVLGSLIYLDVSTGQLQLNMFKAEFDRIYQMPDITDEILNSEVENNPRSKKAVESVMYQP